MSAIPLTPSSPRALPRVGEDEGLLTWVASVDHKQIGLMYLMATFFFFCVGGLESLLMRWQLAQPRNTVLSPEAYNQIFTLHGVTMIFLVVMPMLFGFAIYLVPLMIGANDMAFPRLNALGFWVLLFGGLLLYYSLLGGGAPDAGWFAYAPLTEQQFSSNNGMDFYSMGLLATGVGSVATGINLIVTILTMRAPGMTLRRVPLFVWMVLLNSGLVILALPSLNASLAALFIDRLFHAHFFDPSGGGQPVLWQHFFWSFGHPEVYIMVLPAWGIISEVIPVFSRKPIFGYSFIAMSTVAIFFLSLAVWGHHMFVVGMGRPLDLFFGFTSLAIAVPTGIKIFNWLATMWHGSIRFTTSMLFAAAFIPLFTFGGITGVSFGLVPIDWQVEDSYYVVAHMHYVLFGGTVFAVFAGIYYWFPKMSGKLLSERIGRWHFWATFIGFNMAFFVQHILGLMGMSRRIYTYPNLPGWASLNLISSIGAAILAVSVMLFLWNIIHSLQHGEAAGDNPWDAWSLEWATTSPPPYHNFAQVPPVRSRRPLWDITHPALQQGNPEQGHHQHEGERSATGAQAGPLANTDRATLGMALLIVSESVFFVMFILAFVYYRNSPANDGGPTPAHTLDLTSILPYTLCLWASSATIWVAGRGARRKSRLLLSGGLLATLILGAIFLFGEIREWRHFIDQQFTASRNVFGSTFYTLTGFHGLHVIVGLCLLGILLVLAIRGALTHPDTPRTPGAFEAISLYWHFVDVVWVAVFAVVYVWAALA